MRKWLTKMDRRELLWRLGGTAALMLLLVGCSGTPPTPTRVPKTQSAAPKTAENLGNIPLLIRAGKLAQADEVYAAWRTEHDDTPQVPRTIIALAKAHMVAGEYLLARFYLNEYRRDFPSGRERDRIEYLAVRTLFLQYRQTKDDRLIAPFRAQAKAFRGMFPRSPYRSKVQNLTVKMRQMQNAHYRELAQYYERRGKPKAAAFYQGKIRGN